MTSNILYIDNGASLEWNSDDIVLSLDQSYFYGVFQNLEINLQDNTIQFRGLYVHLGVFAYVFTLSNEAKCVQLKYVALQYLLIIRFSWD